MKERYRIFRIKEWFEYFNIPKQIQEGFKKLGIKYLETPHWCLDDFNKISSHFGYLEYDAIDLNEKASFIIYLINKVSKMKFEFMLERIKKYKQQGYKVIVIINCKRKNYFNLLPDNIQILHRFKTDSIIPQSREYHKKKVYEKLKKLFKNLENLPIKPKAIYGYGSFFREKEKIGDIDLHIEYDDKNPLWEEFLSFFMIKDNDPNREKKLKDYYELRELIIKEREKERTKNKRLNSFKNKAEKKKFQEKIEKFNLNINLLKYCTWGELCGDEDWEYGVRFMPDLRRIFKKIFISRRKGIEINPFSELDDGKNYILLWSKEKPNFENNYNEWKNQHKENYIRKEYLHLVEDIDKWIDQHKNFKKYPTVYSQKKYSKLNKQAIEEYEKLKEAFPKEIKDSDDYKTLSKKINQLRDQMKNINDKILKKKAKLDWEDQDHFNENIKT